MKYRAIIFDFFGTLVEEYDSQMESVRRQMAKNLGIPFEDFNYAWSKTQRERDTGTFRDSRENIVHVLRVLQYKVKEEDITKALSLRSESLRFAMTPRPDAIKT